MNIKISLILITLCIATFSCTNWKAINQTTNEAEPTVAHKYEYYALVDKDTVFANLDDSSIDLLWNNKTQSFPLDYRSDNLFRFFIFEGRKKIGMLDIEGSSYDETIQEYMIFSVWFNKKTPITELRLKSLTFHRME